MAAPIYFFPGRSRGDVVRENRLVPSLLQVTGLADVLDGIASVDRECFCQDMTGRGPGGKSGVLLCVFPPDGEAPKHLGYYPDHQEWHECPAPVTDHPAWLGFERDAPPSPRDLVRPGGGRDAEGRPKALHPGMPLALGPRGEEWIIPVIRRPAFVERYGVASTRLPCDLGWDAEGKFVETVDARYRDVWEATAAIADLFFDADGAMREGGLQIGTEEALRFALRALGLNYRLGKHEQTRLRLVNDRNLWVLLGLTVDFLLVKELTGATREKKSRPAPEPVNMSPGPAGGSTPTDPAAESSG